MKRYKQLIKELPSKKVVFAFGRFQPPTAGHELLVNAVKKLAKENGCDHIIFVSATLDKKKNPLTAERKVHWLKKMFPGVNFVAAPDHIKNLTNAFVSISKKYGGYRDIIMVSGSDRVEKNKDIIEKFNWENNLYDSAEALSIGERDPDSDEVSGMSGTKMREAAVAGDIEKFKKGLPRNLTEHDAKLLMNEIRQGMGKDVIKENVVFERSELRERYHSGDIFKLEEIVESNGEVFKIMKRGSNHLLLQNQNGSLVSKWIQDVQYTNKEFHLEEGCITEMKFNSSDKIKVARIIADTLGIKDVEKSSNPEQLINAALHKIKSKPLRPEYIDVLNNMLNTAREAEIKFDETLVPKKVQETLSTSDVLAQTKKYQDVVNRVKSKDRMNDSDQDEEASDKADETGDHSTKPGHSLVNPGESEISRKMKIRYAMNEDDSIEEEKLSDACWKGFEAIGTKRKYGKTVPNCVPMKEDSEEDSDEDMYDIDDISEKDIDDMVNSVDDIDDVIHAYDDDELALIDDQGNEVDDIKEENELLNEVLSRVERIRAKMRFARTASKRERKIQLALKRRSDSKTINKRARRLAVSMMKTKLTKKQPDKLTLGEKERVERMLAKRKDAINRLAMKLAPRIRKIESDRLSHEKYTK